MWRPSRRCLCGGSQDCRHGQLSQETKTRNKTKHLHEYLVGNLAWADVRTDDKVAERMGQFWFAASFPCGLNIHDRVREVAYNSAVGKGEAL